MINKLAFAGVKKRLKDYLVLFLGLMISSAIFYMFESLATNQSFLKANAQQITGANFIFLFGSILLTIITLVYVFYANSFLMSMRRHDYGLLMMLGAKQSKIGQLIMIETTCIGAFASILGALVGWGLTASIGSFLIGQLIGTKLHHFSAFYLPAMIVTVLLYLGLSLIAGLINRSTLTRTPVLKLLKGDQQPNRPTLKPTYQIVQVVSGTILLAMGYYCMSQITKIGLSTIPIALLTVIGGTYFLFNAVFVWLMRLLKHSALATRGLGNFTLSQLTFRIRNYTKILSVVSILVALALGAITVGIGLRRQVLSMATSNTAYTMAIKDPSQKTLRLINQLHLATKVTYQQKEGRRNVYYSRDQFIAKPFEVTGQNAKMNLRKSGLTTSTYRKLTTQQLQAHIEKLMLMQPGQQQSKRPRIALKSTFEQSQNRLSHLLLFRVKTLKNDLPILRRITRSLGMSQTASLIPGSYGIYVAGNGLFGGLEFMGFFLGIAFLAMLASCLMFKILSGAASDRIRYEMLNKIGTKQVTLRRSISKEILVLFALPGVVGVVHVLFGLQMFKPLMLDPYGQLWVPFTIFFVLYMIYYVITVWLYEHIVIPKLKIDR
ncbi:FtsX-like permease family protein [Secundilactobacillus folii]|uniref:FtsX-like permease family protein n=1 Tax=Secundilactobacillus folii TaxID=2678357 RepID=A0A7X3C2M4_9LACO|nr:FtsX-like permease family protein [Secundilactobacillus folii]MTV83025.1 FtsX-like permease family protein [Secundilactobacillus folii]